jgi:hypothetical protein
MPIAARIRPPIAAALPTVNGTEHATRQPRSRLADRVTIVLPAASRPYNWSAGRPAPTASAPARSPAVAAYARSGPAAGTGILPRSDLPPALGLRRPATLAVVFGGFGLLLAMAGPDVASPPTALSAKTATAFLKHVPPGYSDALTNCEGDAPHTPELLNGCGSPLGPC